MSKKESGYLSLKGVVKNAEPSMPILPLTHCTKSEYFFDIVEAGEIAPRPCKVFCDDVFYLFYGRPSYKPYSNSEYTNLEAFRPVAFILKPDSALSIKRIFPFDTGAHASKLYTDFIPEHASLENFELDASLDCAARSVALFFGDCKNYYLGKTVAVNGVPPTNLTVKSLIGLFEAKGLSKIDDRKSAIEVQVDKLLKLSSSSVMAVCMPSEYREDQCLDEIITKTWRADIIEYDIYIDSPISDLREMKARVKDYLVEKGLL